MPSDSLGEEKESNTILERQKEYPVKVSLELTIPLNYLWRTVLMRLPLDSISNNKHQERT